MRHQKKKKILAEIFPCEGRFWTTQQAMKKMGLTRQELESLADDRITGGVEFENHLYFSDRSIDAFNTELLPVTRRMIFEVSRGA